MVPDRRAKRAWLLVVVAGLVAVAAAVVALATGLIPSHAEVCTADPKTSQERCTAHNVVYFVIWISGEYLNNNSGAISGLATVAIAIFTIILARVGRDQHRAAMDALKLSGDEFTASHPPQVIVRRVSLDLGTLPLNAPITEAWKVQYIVANTGRGKATVFEGNATIADFKDALPAIPPFNDRGDFVDSFDLGAGQSRPLTAYLEKTEIEAFQGVDMIESAGNTQLFSVYFLGYVQYRDRIGIVRRTAFCRRYNPATKRFEVVNDPDYEYN